MEKVKFTRELRVLALAVLAGMAIGIGGVLYLTLENKVVGALMFTVGLYAICAHGLNLFTGKVGYAVHMSRHLLCGRLVLKVFQRQHRQCAGLRCRISFLVFFCLQFSVVF